MPHIHDFARRHLGSNETRAARMLGTLGYESLDQLIDDAVPAEIRLREPLDLPPALTEQEALATLRGIMDENATVRSFIGQGYYGTSHRRVIQRNILENPGWYTAYTPYQAEIAQGRLEALLNFQTMITDLTGLDIANASLLDEGTAAAEAMSLALAGEAEGQQRSSSPTAAIRRPSTWSRTRAEPLGHRGRRRRLADLRSRRTRGLFAVLVQYPDTRGAHRRLRGLLRRGATPPARSAIVAADLLALTLAQAAGRIRRGHLRRLRRSASACRWASAARTPPSWPARDALKRKMPGRLVGVSKDSPRQARLPPLAPDPRAAHPPRQGHQQHLHRPGAARRHGLDVCRLSRPGGPASDIAQRVHATTVALAAASRAARPHGRGRRLLRHPRRVRSRSAGANIVSSRGRRQASTCAIIDADHVGISLDETTTDADLAALARRLRRHRAARQRRIRLRRLATRASPARTAFLTHPVFNRLPHRRPRCCATCKRARVEGSLAERLDDPARLLHDEAQRHLRDDAR